MKHRIITLTVLCAMASALLVLARVSSASATGAAAAAGQQRRQPRGRAATQRRRQTARATAPRGARNYRVFTHTSPTHRGMSCNACHNQVPTPNWPRVREDEGPESSRARDDGYAFPDITDYPDHPSCVRCHQQQFFSGSRPDICTVCHTNVSPRDGTRFPFQNPEERFDGKRVNKRERSEFSIRFPHDKHQDVMAFTRPTFRQEEGGVRFVRAAYRQQEDQVTESCSVCHKTYQHKATAGDDKFTGDKEKYKGKDYVKVPAQDLKQTKTGPEFWLKTGTLKTSPTSHASCFNCHWKESSVQPLATNCAGCHEFLRPGQNTLAELKAKDGDEKVGAMMGIDDPLIMEKWLRRKSATFRHEHPKHVSVGCTACHVQIADISKINVGTLEVPMLTCGGTGTGCHIKQRTGSLNIEVAERRKAPGPENPFRCTKCHVNYGDYSYTEANFSQHKETLYIPSSHWRAVPAPSPTPAKK